MLQRQITFAHSVDIQIRWPIHRCIANGSRVVQGRCPLKGGHISEGLAVTVHGFLIAILGANALRGVGCNLPPERFGVLAFARCLMAGLLESTGAKARMMGGGPLWRLRRNFIDQWRPDKGSI